MESDAPLEIIPKRSLKIDKIKHAYAALASAPCDVDEPTFFFYINLEKHTIGTWEFLFMHIRVM